jgi:hypothetical protein
LTIPSQPVPGTPKTFSVFRTKSMSKQTTSSG